MNTSKEHKHDHSSHEQAVNANIQAFNDADTYDNRESVSVFSTIFAKTLVEKDIQYGATYGEFRKLFSGISDNIIQGHNLDGKIVMDFACGTGMVSKRVIPHMSKGSRLDGVDINGVFLERFDQVTKPLAEEAGVEVCSYKVDILDPKEDKLLSNFESKYDLIYCTLAYHHLHNYEEMTAKLATFLKPNGLLYIIDFYNPDVEHQHLNDNFANQYAIQHMGGLKKSSLIETFSKAGLRNTTVEELCSVASWVPRGFINGHSSVAVKQALEAGKLPKKMTKEGEVFATKCMFLLAIGEK